MPRIALIHALAGSIAPAHAAFAAQWPQARCFDLFDSSLAPDLAQAGRLEAAMIARFETLARYAATTGSGAGEGAGRTAGILFTCSAVGPAIEAAARCADIPVLDPVSPALREAIAAGGRIGLVLSFAPSAPPLVHSLRELAAGAGRSVEVQVEVAEGALAALKADDAARHDALVAAAAARLQGAEVLLLGQFSLARAQEPVARVFTSGPVLTTPGCSVRALRARVGHAEP